MSKRKIVSLVLICVLCIACLMQEFVSNASGTQYITTEGNIIWQKEYCYGLTYAPYAKYENYQGKIKFTFDKNNEFSGRFEDVYDNGKMYTSIKQYDEANKTYISISGSGVWGQCTDGTGYTLNSMSGLKENTEYMLWSNFEDDSNYSGYLVVEFVIKDGVAYFGRSIEGYTEDNYLAGLEFFEYVEDNCADAITDFENSLDRYEANEIYEFARELVKDCDTDFDKVLTIHRWLVDNIEYNHNDVSCGDCILSLKKGICGDISIMTTAMYNSVGIPCVEISSSIMNHAWNMIYVDGHWLTIDNTNGVILDHPSNYFVWTDVAVYPFDMREGYLGICEDNEYGESNDENIAVYGKTVCISEGKTVTLDAGLNVCSEHEFSWESGDESILRIDSIYDDKAIVTALKPGKTTITCRRVGSKELSCTYELVVLDEEYGSNAYFDSELAVNYITHIQSYGWQGDVNDMDTWSDDGDSAGTTGSGKRLEGIKIALTKDGIYKHYDLGIQYTTHCQSYGWLPWSGDGEMSGTEGEAKRLEAIKIQLTGADKDKFDVYYRVHAQTYGWLEWAQNGEPSGTAGLGKRLEAIQIVVLKKGADISELPTYPEAARTEAYIAKSGSSPIVNYPSTSNTNPVIPGADTPNVAYRTHVQSFGWQGWKYNGQMSGTSGLAKRLEGININLTNKPYEGSIVYTTHVQTYGWQGQPDDETRTGWKKNGEMSGTSGEAKRLEAICIDLTGEMAEHYDIYYRVHAQSYGWLGWAKNGEESGTAGYAKRLEGIQIVLVEKGGAAPSVNYGGIQSVNEKPYLKK